MPVLQVFAPEVGDVGGLLAELADGVAHALDLGGGGVIATFVPVSTTGVSGGGSAAPWPIVSVHGSRRPPAATAAATSAAETAVRAWASRAGIALGGVWVEWVEPGFEA